MARYGSSKNYNSSTNYGATAGTEAGSVMWQLLFDWNNDGTLDSTNESDRLINLSIERGRSCYISQQGSGFEHVRPGRMTLTMENHDRRYDPRYASSALYPNVKPGRKVYLAVVDLSTYTTYVVFTGLIDDIVPMARPDGGDVQITCVDYMAILNDQALSFSAAALNTTLTAAYQALLVDAGYPGSELLDTDAQPVIVFGVTDQNAGQVAHELADAGMGTFFVDKYGRACYYGRNHTYPAATALDQAQCLNEPVLVQPWSEVYNHVTVVANRPIKKQPSIIYFLPGYVQLSAATPVILDADYQSASDPQVSTYAVYSNSDESGTNLTSSTTVTSDLGYNGGTVTVTCSSNGYLTQLEIRGRQWDTVIERDVSEDATSQAAYGIRRFVLDSPFMQDPNYSANHAGIIKTFAKDDRESITVQIEAREDLQFGFDLMTPVAFTASTLDLDSTYYVMGLRHDWTKDTGEGTVTTLNLSKIIADSTSVTAASVLKEPAEAPQGFEDPGGDPTTIDAVGDIEDLIGTISGSAGMLSADFAYSSAVPYMQVTFERADVDTGSYTDGSLQTLSVSTAGLYLVGLQWKYNTAITATNEHIVFDAYLTFSASSNSVYAKSFASNDEASAGACSVTPHSLSAGDTIRCYVGETSSAGDASSYFIAIKMWIAKIG